MRFLLPMLLLLPACACAAVPEPQPPPTSSGLTFAAAVGLMCDVDQKAGLSADADPLGVAVKRTAWMIDHADHPDAIELRVLLSVKGPSDQARVLRAQAKELGLPGCALADAVEKQGEGGIAP